MRQTRVINGVSAQELPIDELIKAQEPVILKGVATDWPLARKGLEGARAAIDYLASFDVGRAIVGYTGEPGINGRFFYNSDVTGMNYEARRVGLTEFLKRISDHLDDSGAPSFYIGSADLDAFFPGLQSDNGLDHLVFGAHPPIPMLPTDRATEAA